jgi:hypothetical protein
MAEDNDFFDRTQAHWSNRGQEYSPEAAVNNFKLYGPRKRAEALDQLDSEIRNFEPSMENLRKVTELSDLGQQLRDTHDALLKAKR